MSDAALYHSLPAMEEAKMRQLAAVVLRVQISRSKRELTPDAALQFWAEYLAIQDMHRAMATSIRVAAEQEKSASAAS